MPLGLSLSSSPSNALRSRAGNSTDTSSSSDDPHHQDRDTAILQACFFHALRSSDNSTLTILEMEPVERERLAPTNMRLNAVYYKLYCVALNTLLVR